MLDGARFIGINGGPEFSFNEAVSFTIECRDQDEVDHYWNALSMAVRNPGDADQSRAVAATRAMLAMRKIVIADLEAAANR